MSSNEKAAAAKDDRKLGLVPRLRFPEFRGTKAWESSALGELMQITSSKRVHESDWTERGVPFYRAREIVALRNLEPISPLYVSEDLYRENAKQSGEIAEGDLLVTGVGSIGVPYLVKANDRFCFKDGNIIWLKNRGTKLLGRFLFLLYETRSVQSQIKTMAGVGTVGTYTIDNANRTSVVFPSHEAEQQKIAACLTAVDEVIAAQARKVDALKSHKKGLMQKLFPREGETQPQLRFPEFQKDGEWFDQSIGDFGRVVTGSTPSTAQTAFYGGGIPFVSPADISDMRFIDQTRTTLTAEGFAETRPVRAGSVLFVCIGSTIGKVAQNVHDCATNQQINTVIPNSEHSDGFAYFALSYASERIALFAGRQAVPIINKSMFSSVRLLVPKLPEQHRIASCLSSLDALIAAETQKLQALKRHKRGLMQQLFPSSEVAEA